MEVHVQTGLCTKEEKMSHLNILPRKTVEVRERPSQNVNIMTKNRDFFIDPYNL